jgi:hypothetical protein
MRIFNPMSLITIPSLFCLLIGLIKRERSCLFVSLALYAFIPLLWNIFIGLFVVASYLLTMRFIKQNRFKVAWISILPALSFMIFWEIVVNYEHVFHLSHLVFRQANN